MNVSLTEHLDKFVGQQVDTGRYRSASEVVREGSSPSRTKRSTGTDHTGCSR